jgi:hypothetical protein
MFTLAFRYILRSSDSPLNSSTIKLYSGGDLCLGLGGGGGGQNGGERSAV